MNVSVRKISDVKLSSEYLRLATDVTALKKSIESVGLIHPVTINPRSPKTKSNAYARASIAASTEF